MSIFQQKLREFVQWAYEHEALLGRDLEAAINSYPRALGDTNNPTLMDSLSSVINNAAKTYMDSLTTYYTAMGKVADLKLLAQGSGVTQTANAAMKAGAYAASVNPLWYIGGGLLVVYLVTKR